MSEILSAEWHCTNESIDSGKHGKDYEIDIAKFLFKRLVDANLKNFKFTREKGGLGKFDDLTYIYQNEEGQNKFCLIQLKHVLDTSKKIDYDALATNKRSYFLLQKYFSHFKESSKTFSQDKDFADCELESLIICTNAKLEDDLGDIWIQPQSSAGFFQNSGKYCKLKITNDAKRKIFAESYLHERETLANELVFSMMQCKLLDINSFKKDEHVSMLKKYHVALADNVIDVPTKKFRLEFLEGSEGSESEYDEVKKFRQCFFDSLSKFHADNKDADTNELKKKLNIKLKSAEVLKNYLSNYELYNCPIEFLKQQKFAAIRPNFGNSFLYPNDLATLPTKDSCVVELDKEIDHFLNLLIFATEENNNVNIINKEIEPNTLNEFNNKMNSWYYHGSYEEYSRGSSLKKRTWITKKDILCQGMKSPIIFQGRQVELQHLISDTSLICPKTLLNLFCSKLISIGREPPLLGDVEDYYIPRTFTQKKTILIDAIKSCKEDVIIISKAENITCFMKNTLTHLSLQENKPGIVLIDGTFHFEEFIRNNQTDISMKNIHWLKLKENGTLEWQNTYGSLSTLRNYICHESANKSFLRESDIMNNRLVVIAGEPGMGKTTFLNMAFKNVVTFSHDTERPNWIIHISLKKCQNIPKYFNEPEYLNNIIDFLASFENEMDTFSKNILTHFLNEDRRVILLLDGFDELQSKEDQENIESLVAFLNENLNLKSIWLTTRPHYVEKLENSLGTMSFSLDEINEGEQISFLTKYWQSNDLHQRENLSQNAREIMKCNRIFYDHSKKCFLGIPLRIHMFAVLYLKIAKKEQNPPHTVQIIPLLEVFLQTLYKIYFEKSGENILLWKKNQQLLTNLLDNIHQDFALRYSGLLSPEEIQLFDRRNCYDDDQLLDIGIVCKAKDQYYFTHQTFAEYLMVKRLVALSFKENSLYMQVREVLKRVLRNSKHFFLLYLFDAKLTEMFPIHNSVLNGEVDVVKRLKKAEINSEDSLGRTTLYYALQYRHHNIIDILLTKGAVVNKNDQFTITSLIEIIKHYYLVSAPVKCVDIDLTLFQRWYKNIAKQIFDSNTSGVDYPQELLRAYMFEIEVKLRNWDVVKLMINSKLESYYSLYTPYSYCLILIENEAPIELVLMLLSRYEFDQMESTYDERIERHLAVLKYVLHCDTGKLEELAGKYPNDLMNLLNLFSDNSGTNKPTSFLNLLNAYKDLDHKILKGKSLAYLLFTFERRATNFTIMVEFLFLHMLQCDSLYTRLSWKDFLNDSLFDSLSFVAINQSIENFMNTINKGASIPKIQLWSILENFRDSELFTMQTSVADAICRVLHSVWNSSRGLELIDLFHKLHKRIQLNDVHGVGTCLLVASACGWIEPILNARNCYFEDGYSVARRYKRRTILNVIKIYQKQFKERIMHRKKESFELLKKLVKKKSK